MLRQAGAGERGQHLGMSSAEHAADLLRQLEAQGEAKGVHTARDAAYKGFQESELGKLSKREVGTLLKKLQSGMEVGEILEEEFPGYDPTWLDEAA